MLGIEPRIDRGSHWNCPSNYCRLRLNEGLNGLPEAFKEVNKRLPLVEKILSAARTQLEKGRSGDEAVARFQPILKGSNAMPTTL